MNTGKRRCSYGACEPERAADCARSTSPARPTRLTRLARPARAPSPAARQGRASLGDGRSRVTGTGSREPENGLLLARRGAARGLTAAARAAGWIRREGPGRVPVARGRRAGAAPTRRLCAGRPGTRAHARARTQTLAQARPRHMRGRGHAVPQAQAASGPRGLPGPGRCTSPAGRLG